MIDGIRSDPVSPPPPEPPPPPPPAPKPVAAPPPDDGVDDVSANAATDGLFDRPPPVEPAAPGLPATPAELPARYAELKDKSPEELQKTYESMKKLGSDKLPEQIAALGELSEQFPENLAHTLQTLGVQDNRLVKLATKPEALAAVSTLSDPAASNVDRAKAAMNLAKQTGDVFKPEDLKGVLGHTLNALPVGPKLIDAVVAWSDPGKSGLDKARATLELGDALRDFTGESSAGLKKAMDKLDGSFGAVTAGLTLADPEASVKDRIIAGAQLAAEIPGLRGDLTRFKQLLATRNVPGAELVADEAERLASKLGPDDLKTMTTKLDSPAAVDGFLRQVDKLDAAACKRLVGLTRDMDGDVLKAALSDPGKADSLGKLAGNLQDGSVEDAAKLLKDLDEGSLESLLKLTDRAPPEVLNAGVKLLGTVVDTVGGKVVGKGMELLDKLLGKMGTAITQETAEKVFKTMAKVLPAVGAVPGLIDAGRYTKEAIDLHDKNKDLAMFATVGAGLNAIDSVGGLLLDATGVGVAVDVGVGVAFGVAELAVDLSFDAEKHKLEADPDGYQAPGWMKAVNLGFAAATAPAGVAALVANYGVDGTADLVAWAADSGMDAAGKLMGNLRDLGADGVKVLEDLASRGLHAAGDVLASLGRGVKDATDGEVSIGGRRVDVNPIW